MEASGKTGAGSAAPSFISEGIPAELKELHQWVARRGKVLVDPKSGENAKTNDSSTWGTFEEAVRRAADDELDGIGFVFTKGDPYTFIDLDRCFDPEAGEIEPWASEIIKTLNSYTEFSTSGRGVHVVVRGEKPGSRCRTSIDGHRVELYDSAQYMAFTGDCFPGTPTTVEERQGVLAALYRELFGDAGQHDDELTEPVSPPMSDEEVLQRCREAKNAAKFERLWSGDASGYDSPSEADQALVSILAFFSQNHEQIDRLFRKSGLMRSKWAEREDYRVRSISKVLTQGRDYFGDERGRPTVVFVDETYDDNGATNAANVTDAAAGVESAGEDRPTNATDATNAGGGGRALPPAPPFPVDALPRP